jgi:hypothetical protein
VVRGRHAEAPVMGNTQLEVVEEEEVEVEVEVPL